MTWPFDVAVAGAGAAGLVAAIRAAERGRRVVLLEKNRRPGVKILMSGGTRCNVTHATDTRGIVQAFGPPGKFLHSSLAAFGVDDALAFFRAEGVETKVEEGGKIFPVSDRAADVLDALLRRLHRSGAALMTEAPVEELTRTGDGFAVRTPHATYCVPRVILTTGGQSYPGSGTTGDGYRFAQSLGHTLIVPRPALTPLRSSAAWVAELRGVTLADAGIAIEDAGQVLDRRRGGLLFAHFGLTGPAPLDASRVVTGHAQPASLVAVLDFVPATKEPALDEFLRAESLASGKKQLAVVLGTLVPRRLADVLLDQAQLPRDRKAAGLAKEDRRRLARALKRTEVPLAGALGFAKAEVTAGGVPLAEVDSRTLESKRVPGLHFAGEILDLDGPIGGYNFQAAWSTGWLAGSSV